MSLVPPTQASRPSLSSSSMKRMEGLHLKSRARKSCLFESSNNNNNSADAAGDNADEETTLSLTTSDQDDAQRVKASKRQMLGFAIPALGIYLSNPLLSNIDNSFVGKTVGTQGLAALSPATICTDQMLYLFSFLGRATTSLVARAYGVNGDVEKAREAASPALTVSLLCGIGLSLFYAKYTPQMLALLNVQPQLMSSASSYIYWRGAIAWAALSQSVALSVMMATRDSITPLKIIGFGALVNIVGDYLLCVSPLRLGTSGAAAATAFATLCSSFVMWITLAKKKMLPRIRVPSRKEMAGLLEFTGPLLAITITRLVGFVSMQRAAMRMGVQHLAAYQLSINVVMFFLLFGEPLSQLSQTKLPALIDTYDGPSVRATLRSVLILGLITALGVGTASGLCLRLGANLFSSDLAVQSLAREASPAVLMAVATAVFAVTVDGAMLAARDFGFMLFVGTVTMLLQQRMLASWATSISMVYATFTFRLGSYALLSLLRMIIGQGPLGRFIRRGKVNGEVVNGASSKSVSTVKML